MRVPADDLYARLGVSQTAGLAELRRAYRLLALRLHPDRAGVDSTLPFQRVAEAYRILSDPTARASYDHRRRAAAPRTAVRPDGARAGAPPPQGTAGRRGEYAGFGGRITWRSTGVVLDRLSGTIDDLLTRAAARRSEDGALELLLTRAEAALGGRAAIETPVAITCPTCAGVAALHQVWCCRCEYEGRVVDEVAILVDIPRDVRDRKLYVFETDPAGMLPPLRVRVRVG